MAEENMRMNHGMKQHIFAVAAGMDQQTAIIDIHIKNIERLQNIIGARDAEIFHINARNRTLQTEAHDFNNESGRRPTNFEEQLRAYVAENERLRAELAAAKKSKDRLRLQLVEANARLGRPVDVFESQDVAQTLSGPMTVGETAKKHARTDDLATNGLKDRGTAINPVELEVATDLRPQKHRKVSKASLEQPANPFPNAANGPLHYLLPNGTQSLYEQKRIVVLPPVPKARESEKPEEMAYWVKQQQQQATGDNKELSALATRPKNTKKMAAEDLEFADVGGE